MYTYICAVGIGELNIYTNLIQIKYNEIQKVMWLDWESNTGPLHH